MQDLPGKANDLQWGGGGKLSGPEGSLGKGYKYDQICKELALLSLSSLPFI